MNPDAKTPEQKLRRYLGRMREIRGGNPVDEAAYYGALEELLNAVGAELKPKVVANFQLGQSGHGQPDFGLFTADQIKRGKKAPAALPREKPARGAGEVKGLAADLRKLADSEQVGKYLDGYGLVLATNFRGFALVERDRENGKPVVLESRQIAQSEDDFWRGHSAIPGQHGPALCEFLARAMTHAAPISRAEDVANLLASYAREAAAILEKRDASALKPLRDALEASLGIKFEGGDGDHFFRSTLVQTVFYGLFSAWMESNGEKFDWKSAAFALKTPVIRTLFSEIVKPRQIGDLGLLSLLQSASDGLNRIADKRRLFGEMGAFDAIQHFYEPFLAAFDPKLRKELGVWYTPPEVVRYMVRRVDAVLKDELNIPDGLASDQVRVLDPCGGTGAYLAETLRVIRETLEKRNGKAMAARGVKRAARERVFGFEILPASFVVAHWQIGALLEQAGAPLAEDERAAVYLTNSLTGWEREDPVNIVIPDLAEERVAAGKVKRKEPVLVVIGNPPYNAYAGTSPAQEGGLVAPYVAGLHDKWGLGNFNLHDLYVRFFRIAENRIVKTGRGIVCYISNSSYVDKPSFVVMREKLLRSFNSIWVDNMNGSSRATGKKTPDGLPDPSVFSTEMNKVGIQVGTAVGLFVRRSDDSAAAAVRYRDFWGKSKRADLLSSLESGKPEFQAPDSRARNRFSFRPLRVGENYSQWPLLPDIFQSAEHNGMLEMRGGALIDIDEESLEKRMRDYFNPDIEWAAYQKTGGGLARDAARFNAADARRKFLGTGFNPDNIIRYGARPFDFRFAYHTNIRPLWGEPRPEFWDQAKSGNSFLLSRKGVSIDKEGAPMFFANSVCDYHFFRGDTKIFPLRLWREEMGKRTSSANLSDSGRSHLRGLGFSDPDASAESLFMHALAIGFSPEYRAENADGLRIDWPRIPMPRSREALENSAGLGRKVARLLDSDAPAEGVDSGAVAERFRRLGVLDVKGPLPLDLSVRAGWGHRDGQGKVFPGSGLLEFRDWSSEEISEWVGGERKLPGRAADVYLNGRVGSGTFWGGVPEAAWDFRIGGYQVLKKWLSYREGSVLGRPLRDEEALHFTGMVRRLSALVLLTDELDANYRAARDSAGEWGK